MRVTEIFHSIQGESTYAGQPCVFIRLTGCPLRCTWCDTAYAFHGGTEQSIDEILKVVREYECRLVEVTGGEPLAQTDAGLLLSRLCGEDFTVLLETSGAVDTMTIDPRVHIILDVKCPGSGMTAQMHWPHVQRLRPQCSIAATQAYLGLRHAGGLEPETSSFVAQTRQMYDTSRTG
jgi:7-carboxy-7-deazaguanine synthase